MAAQPELTTATATPPTTSRLMALPAELLLDIVEFTIAAEDEDKGTDIREGERLSMADWDLLPKYQQAFAVCKSYGDVFTRAYDKVVQAAEVKSQLQINKDGSTLGNDDFGDDERFDLKGKVGKLSLGIVVKHSAREDQKKSLDFISEEEECDEVGCEMVQQTLDVLERFLTGFKGLRSLGLTIEASAMMEAVEGKALVEGVKRIWKRREEATGRRIGILDMGEGVPAALCVAIGDTTMWVEEDELREEV